MQAFRNTLRTAQQAGDTEQIKQLLETTPEAEIAEDRGVFLAVAVARSYLQDVECISTSALEVGTDECPDAAALADLGFLLMSSARATEATSVLTLACDQADAGFEAFMRLGALKVASGELAQAKRCFERSQDLAPKRGDVASNLGGVYFRLGDYEKALEQYDQAIALMPELPQPHTMRAQTLKKLDRVDELIEEAEANVAAAPNNPLSHQSLALIQSQVEQWAQANATLSAAIERFPENDDLKRQLINSLMTQQAYWRAGTLLKEWVEERDEPDWTFLALNRMRIEARLLDAAEQSLDELADSHLANEPQYLVLRAKLLIERSQAEEAVEVLEHNYERFPGNIETRNLLAHTLTSLGRLDEAIEINDALSTTNPMAVVRQVADNNDNATDDQVIQLEKLFTSDHLTSDQKANVGFTLAPALDKRKEHEKAFEIISQANAYENERLNYDWREHRRFIDRSIGVFDQALVERLSRLGSDSHRPIFVCGMPRSGTTLTEQILCTHPDVYGAGELPWVGRITNLMKKVMGGTEYPEAMADIDAERLKSAAHYYLDRLNDQEDLTPRVVDKLPHNFHNIGLIALMFPHSPIIHMDRDIRDVAISNFYQNFAAKRGTMGFAFDLEDIGHMLNDHERIMQHWHEVFPGRIYELNYARLVSDPEPTIRELLEFCNLEWDDQVMRFYETQRPVRTASIRQVRQGFYTSSTQKWRRYEAFLDPLEKVLAEGYRPLDEIEQQGPANALAGPTGLAGL